MNTFLKYLTAVSLVGSFSWAARVAVTDSGTDFSHEWLKSRALINENEIAGNRVDDDRNKKVDDLVGWNFADNYGHVFFRQHLTSVTDRIYKIMDILSRIQADTATKEDLEYWKNNISNLTDVQKKQLMGELNFFGQYAHSTHVSGIIASVHPESKMISNRVFPDMPMSESFETLFWGKKKTPSETKGVSDLLYKLLANIANGTFNSAAQYIAERNIDVANYSLGASLQTIANLALVAKGIKNPTPEQIAEETKKIFAQYEPIGKKWLASASKTLFVMAAGNDGSDNDKLPVFPAGIAADNSITVAASSGISSLASFSNFGIKTVDIAAPGVAIKSSVPSLDNKMVLPMSGTSMAAPYIAGVAAKLKDINPNLSPKQMKQILMGTVDKKPWLANKVISQGVVNSSRAYQAADKSKSMSIEHSIAEALKSVPDQVEVATPKRIFKVTPSYTEMKDIADSLVF